MTAPRDVPAVVHRLRDALNRHDIDALVACFDPDFRSEQPAHPARAFRGNAQVRKNWTTMFNGLPDLQAEIAGSVTAGESVWSEWRWKGMQRDGKPRELRGVIIFRVQDDHIMAARLYMEPVEVDGDDIDASLSDLRRPN